MGPVMGSVVMQWYIFLTTGTLVRAEGIITELVFEHALRIRMKAQVATDKSSSREASTTGTPETASIVGSEDLTGATAVNSSGDNSNASGSGDETLPPSSRAESVKGNSDKGKQKSRASSIKSTTSQKSTSKPDSSSSTDNLVGKLNNLVTTDLANIVEGRDFMLLGKNGYSLSKEVMLILSSSCIRTRDGWYRYCLPL